MDTATDTTNTLIATFATYSIAMQASRELEDSGIPSNAIHVDSNQKTAGAGSGGYENAGNNEENRESGFAGWWHSLFGSDTDNEERTGYENALSSGSAILRVTVPARQLDSATEILNRNGAVDIDKGSNTSRTGTGTRTEDGGSIQVVEEELQVGKRAVRRGGVRIYSHVVTQPVEQQINLREEHVNVQRRPVNREIGQEEVAALRDQTIEVAETAEEPIVAKRARVREEVVVGKETTERTETVRDNVRRTEVEVEELGSQSPPTGASKTSRSTRPAGASPNSPSPSALSGFGSTAGAGTLAGETTAGTANDLSSSYRREFEQPVGSGSNFEDDPAYQYGYRNASDARYRGKSWDQVENDLRSDYERTNPGSAWDKVKASVRSGWDKVTGRS